jgi:hypothetical protein
MSAAIPFVTEDRPLDTVLRALCADLQACRWSLYPSGTVPPMEPI